MRRDEAKTLMNLADHNAKQTERVMNDRVRSRSSQTIKKYRREPKGPASLLSAGG